MYDTCVTSSAQHFIITHILLSIAILHLQTNNSVAIQFSWNSIPDWQNVHSGSVRAISSCFYSSSHSVDETIIVPLISARWFYFSSNYSLIMRRDNNTSRGKSKMHDLCVCLHSVTFNGLLLLLNSSIYHFRIIKQFRSSNTAYRNYASF